jgi:hypothetical protein
MSRNDSEQSPFDKNLRSLLDAVAMFEREAGLLMDRFGFDTEAIGKVFDVVGSISSDAIRPLASALGIADAAAVEALARDVRALLQSDARVRREQAAAAARLDELLAAVEALGTTTATLADLQSRTQDRLDALAERASSIDATGEQRSRLAEDVDRLRQKIDALEKRLQAELGLAPDGSMQPEGEQGPPPGVKAAARRPMPRPVTPPGGSKILEALPTLEPKLRPA